ncbi:MAG: EamA family transporter [Candidatus Zixiibacteriota bacterium]
MADSSQKAFHTAPTLLAILAAALFGAATPASKYLLGGMSAFHLAGLLYLGAAIAVLPLSLKSRIRVGTWKIDGKNRWRLLGAVVCGGLFGPVFLLLGLKVASAASVSMWLNLELVATALLGRLLFHDHLGRFGWIGVIGVVASGILLSYGGGAAGLIAGGLVALACLCWGFDNHFTALIDGITPAESTLWKGLTAGLVNLVIGITFQPSDVTTTTVSLGLLIGAFAYGASIVLYITSAQQIGATRAQMLFATSPFFGVFLSAFVLQEPISIVQGIAAAILAASVGAMFIDKHEHEHLHFELEHTHSHRHDDQHHDHLHEDKTEPGLRHSHKHRHTEITHSHPHWPDLHHRHQHKNDDRK